MSQTSKPLTLSIVIPAYNEAGYLQACLESISQQVEMPDEVIVVDNNSTDATANIAALFPFVRVVRAKRQGIVHARNAGFDAATSDIIGRIDADTQLSPTWAMQVREAFARQPAMDAMTGRCYFYDFPWPRAALKSHELTYYLMQSYIAGTEILWGSNMAIRRSTWQKVRHYCSLKLDVPEDIDLTLVLQEKKNSILRLPEIEAVVSLRRGKLSPYAAARYLRWWPRVYSMHGRHVASAAIWLQYIGIISFSVFMWPILSVMLLQSQGRRASNEYVPEVQ